MQILTRARRKSFDQPPKFNTTELATYLSIDSGTRKALRLFRGEPNKIAFLVQRAYFRAKGRFFDIKDFESKVVKKATYNLGLKGSYSLENLTYRSVVRQKTLILKEHGWTEYDASARVKVLNQAMLLVDKQAHGEDILFALLAYCWKERLEIPSYGEFSGIISEAFENFETKAFEKLEKCLTDHQQDLLLNLLEAPPLGQKFGDLKKIDQSTTMSVMKKNAAYLSFFQGVYTEIEGALDQLSLTDEAIKYFATSVTITGAAPIKRFKRKFKKCLYLACFVRDQYFQRQDFAVDAMVKTVRTGLNQYKSVENKRALQVQEESIEVQRTMTNGAQTAIAIIKKISEISKDQSISHPQRVEQIEMLTDAYWAAERPDLEGSIARSQMQTDSVTLKTQLYELIFDRENSWQKSIGPLLKVLSFDKNHSNQDLIKAIEHYKKGISKIDSRTPIAHLKPREKELLLSEHQVPEISRYKALLFVAVEKAIKERTLTLLSSYRYRHTTSYLIPDNLWRKRRDEYLKAANLDRYTDCSQTLERIGTKLTQQYIDTNELLLSNDCNGVELLNSGEWRIEKQEASYDSSAFIPGLLKNEKNKNLVDVLHSATEYAPAFTQSFRHYGNKDRTLEADQDKLFGSIISLGTNLGHNNMARASPDVTIKQLKDTEALWLSNSNLKRANSAIVKAIQSLPLPTIYIEQDDRIHSSSDGQKVVVAVDSLLANYSYKYYGKEQGVSVNSFLDEKQSFFHVNVLSSSDREAAFMMDGLVASKNVTFTEPDLEHLHTTDTHGYTEAIFAGLHFLDVSFAPRIKNVHKQSLYAYESKSIKKKSNFLIAPKRAINKKLIIDHWDEIMRLMASIILGYCSASLVFRILSSSKTNRLYQALKEFGRLLKSSFILQYATDPDMQRTIQKQQNRVELGQKMSKAIFFGRRGKLLAGREEDIEKSVLAMNLIKNAIILWNYCFLSDLIYKCKDQSEKQHYLDAISTGSVISWAHINMHGTYLFKNKNTSRPFQSTFRQMRGLKLN